MFSYFDGLLEQVILENSPNLLIILKQQLLINCKT